MTWPGLTIRTTSDNLAFFRIFLSYSLLFSIPTKGQMRILGKTSLSFQLYSYPHTLTYLFFSLSFYLLFYFSAMTTLFPFFSFSCGNFWWRRQQLVPLNCTHCSLDICCTIHLYELITLECSYSIPFQYPCIRFSPLTDSFQSIISAYFL